MGTDGEILVSQNGFRRQTLAALASGGSNGVAKVQFVAETLMSLCPVGRLSVLVLGRSLDHQNV